MDETEVRAAIAALVDHREELGTLRTFFQEKFPEEWERLTDLEKSLEAKQEAAKQALRTIGTNTSVLGYSFKIRQPVSKVVDIPSMVEKAKDRGDLYTLLEYGVLAYSAVPDQIERLPEIMKAIYSGFVTEKKGTPQVTLPADLK